MLWHEDVPNGTCARHGSTAGGERTRAIRRIAATPVWVSTLSREITDIWERRISGDARGIAGPRGRW